MSQVLSNINLSDIEDIAISHNESGGLSVELSVKPVMHKQGEGLIPSVTIAGLDIRVDENEVLEIHNIKQGNEAFIGFVSYVGFEWTDDGYKYDSALLEVFRPGLWEDHVENLEFDTIKDALLYVRQNYQSEESSPQENTGTSIRGVGGLGSRGADSWFGRGKS